MDKYISRADRLEAANDYFSVNNERWITIKPHGEDSDDYRRLKLEDGETPKEAIDRVYKKKDKKNKKQSYKDRLNKNIQEREAKYQAYLDVELERDKLAKELDALIADITDSDKINEIARDFANKHYDEISKINEKSLKAHDIYTSRDKEFLESLETISGELKEIDLDKATKEELEDVLEAIKLTTGYGINYATRQQLIDKREKIKQKIKSLEYLANRKELTEVVGVKKGKPMSHKEADSGNTNPKYKPHSDYSTNCQSCVVCYELRRRGFNVQTRPRIKVGQMQRLAQNATLAYIDPKTGQHPNPDIMRVGNPTNAYKWLNDNVGEGRYEFRVVWKSRYSGHIMTITKENGKVSIYDPQTNKTYSTQEEITKEILNDVRFRGKENTKPFILRVDNLDLNPEIVNEVVEKS